MKTTTINKQGGGIMILTVIIIATVALIMAYSSSILGLGELDLGYTSQKGAETFSITDGCMEEALHRIHLDTSYGIGVGTINLLIGNGSCTIDITDLGGNQRRILVSGTISDYTKRIESELILNGNIITVTSWTEKPN